MHRIHLICLYKNETSVPGTDVSNHRFETFVPGTDVSFLCYLYSDNIFAVYADRLNCLKLLLL